VQTVLPLKARPAERCVDSMMASRGMGDISPSKMPKGKKKARRDDTEEELDGAVADAAAEAADNK